MYIYTYIYIRRPYPAALWAIAVENCCFVLLKQDRESFEIVVSGSPRRPHSASFTSPGFTKKSNSNQTPHTTQKNKTLRPKGLQTDVQTDV